MVNLRSKLITVVLGCALLMGSTAVAQDALVWATGNGGAGTQFVADYVMQYGCFSSVTASDENFMSLATLLNYDAVLYFSNSSGGQDPNAIGDVLADYADTGRRLVIATFSWANQGSNTLGGRIINDQICPLLMNGGSLYSNVTMASNDGGPYFGGVNTVNGFYHDAVTLSAGAVQHGLWSDGQILLADKANVVGVNLFPDGTWGAVSGDYQQLFANAMCSGPIAVEQATWGGVKALFK